MKFDLYTILIVLVAISVIFLLVYFYSNNDDDYVSVTGIITSLKCQYETNYNSNPCTLTISYNDKQNNSYTNTIHTYNAKNSSGGMYAVNQKIKIAYLKSNPNKIKLA